MTTLDQGFRDIELAGNVHDIDEKRHQAMFRFPHDDQPDSYRTSWDPYVFEDSLRSKLVPGGKGLPMLWQHDPKEPIGRAIDHESLRHETRIRNSFSPFDAVARSKQAFTQLLHGDVGGISFHYRDGRSAPHRSVRGARRYTKANIMETSVVTYPAIFGAKATDLRSRDDGGIRSAIATINRRYGAPPFRDDWDKTVADYEAETRHYELIGDLADRLIAAGNRHGF